MEAPSGNRLLVTTADNHQAWLWFTHVYSLICVILTGVMRAWRKRGRAAYSDAVLLFAHILYIAYWIVIVYAAINSLGKSQQITSEAELNRASKLVYASRILLVAIAGSAKLSTILLIEEVFTKDLLGKWAQLLNTLVVGQAIVGSLMISVGCSPTYALLGSNNNQCTGSTVRWSLFTITEAVLECLILIPVSIVMLRLKTSVEVKVWAIAVFSARLVILVPAWLHLAFYIHFERNGRTNIDAIPTIVTEQIWVALVLIAASLPIIMRITKKFSTSGLMLVPKTLSSTSESHFRQSLRNKRGRDLNRLSNESNGAELVLRYDDHGIHTTSTVGGRKNKDTFSTGDEGSSFRSKSDLQDGIVRKYGFNVSWEDTSR